MPNPNAPLPAPMYGYYGDVNNTIPVSNVYPGGRATAYVPPTSTTMGYRNNSSGELAALNQDAYRQGMRIAPSTAPAATAPSSNGGFFGKPASWWILFAITFVVFVWLARRYDTGGNFGNLRMSVYNGLFLTFWMILILNLMKVFAAKVKIPGASELILAA